MTEMHGFRGKGLSGMIRKNVKEFFKVKAKLKNPKFRAFETETLLKINVKENLKIQNIVF